MALTDAEALAQWKAANPRPADESQADYDARAIDMAALLKAQSIRWDEAAAKAQIKQQFIDGLVQLQADLNFINGLPAGTNLTGAQIKTGFQHIQTSLLWLGERIKDGTIPTNQ